MIEISHQQAQRLIRKGMDSSSGGRRLPEEQWTALQAHLEHCPQCRAYARQRQDSERDLARLLRLRWNSVNGPNQGITRDVIQAKKQASVRGQRRKKVFTWLGITLALAVVIAFRGVFFGSETSQIPITPTPEVVEVIPTPTPISVFRGVMAFESRHTRNTDIFILNAGSSGKELTNLTDHPAEDTSPAWSPDGEWIAFLSDRDTAEDQDKRSEVYVINVAGSRITRLTADPRLDWQGPLSWSMDGLWIAARASRLDQNEDTYIYLVPLDVSNPRTPDITSVAFSRNSGPPRMSPNHRLLAFQSRQPEGQLLGYSLDSGWYDSLNDESLSKEGLLANGPFDWSIGGQRVIYMVEGPYNQDLPPQLLEEARSEVLISPAINLGTRAPATGSWAVDSGTNLGFYRAVSWVPNSLMVAMVQDGDGDGCWTAQLKPSNRLDMRTRELPGLCIEGGLASENWLPLDQPEQEERWLVLRARRESESLPGLYAVRLNAVLDNPDDHLYERIEVPGVTDTSLLGQPQARPTGFRLAIRPRAAQPAAGALPPLPVEPLEDISLVTSAAQGDGHYLLRLDAGNGWQTLLSGGGFNCVKLSPDGSKVAYVAYASDPGTQINDVFVFDLEGERPPRQLTSANLAGPPSSFTGAVTRYSCPTWSPDGNLLAAVLFAPRQTYLALIPVDGSKQPDYLAIDPVSFTTPPVWFTGEERSRIALLYPASNSRPARIVALDFESEANQAALAEFGPADVETLQELTGYSRSTAMTISPDGLRFAAVMVYPAQNTGQATSPADMVHGSLDGELQIVRLPNYDPDQAQPNSLSWLPDGQVGMLLYQTLNRTYKALLVIYNPASGDLTQLIALEDLVYRAVWTSDGQWVFYTSESGMWGLSVPGALAGESTPARLLTNLTYGLDVP